MNFIQNHLVKQHEPDRMLEEKHETYWVPLPTGELNRDGLLMCHKCQLCNRLN